MCCLKLYKKDYNYSLANNQAYNNSRLQRETFRTLLVMFFYSKLVLNILIIGDKKQHLFKSMIWNPKLLMRNQITNTIFGMIKKSKMKLSCKEKELKHD